MKKQRGLGKGLDLIFAENTAENGSEAVTIAINEVARGELTATLKEKYRK